MVKKLIKDLPMNVMRRNKSSIKKEMSDIKIITGCIVMA